MSGRFGVKTLGLGGEEEDGFVDNVKRSMNIAVGAVNM